MSRSGPEGKVKDKIKAYLTSIGAYYFMPVQTGYGKKAVDFLCCIQGKWVSIETKRPGKLEASPSQRLHLAQIHDAGGFGFVTDSLERTKKMIEDHVLNQYEPVKEK